MIVDDLVCPFCGDLGLRASAPRCDGITPDAIICHSCGGRHDVIAGAAYPGGFDEEDFVDVVTMVTNRPHFLPISTIRSMNETFGQALASQDVEAAFALPRGDLDQAVLAANFPTWRHFNAMLGADTFAGAAVLALGTGLGFDAVRVIDVGGTVTFLEASPSSLAARQRMDPELRWVGGLAHRIPFDDETFDLVCYDCIAGAPSARALRDILRTLKVGARLFLSGVALDAPEAGGDHREGLSRFAALHDAIRALPVACVAALITRTAAVDRLRGAGALGANVPDCWVPAWDENFDVLREVASFSSLVVVRTAGVAPAFRTVDPLSIRAGMVAAWSGDQATGVERMMAFAPESLTLFGPRRPLEAPPRGHGPSVLARWCEDIDVSSPPRAIEVACDGRRELELMVNGRLERTVTLDDDGRGTLILAPRETGEHVLVELHLPRSAAGDTPPNVAIARLTV